MQKRQRPVRASAAARLSRFLRCLCAERALGEPICSVLEDSARRLERVDKRRAFHSSVVRMHKEMMCLNQHGRHIADLEGAQRVLELFGLHLRVWIERRGAVVLGFAILGCSTGEGEIASSVIGTEGEDPSQLSHEAKRWAFGIFLTQTA